MKKQVHERLLSLILAIAMFCSMVPSAFAAEESEPDTKDFIESIPASTGAGEELSPDDTPIEPEMPVIPEATNATEKTEQASMETPKEDSGEKTPELSQDSSLEEELEYSDQEQQETTEEKMDASVDENQTILTPDAEQSNEIQPDEVQPENVQSPEVELIPEASYFAEMRTSNDAVFHYFKMNDARNFYQASIYETALSKNTISYPVNLENWVHMSFAIQCNQPVNLAVYEANPFEYFPKTNELKFNLGTDPGAEDYIDKPEPFLGSFLGYVQAVPLTEHIKDNGDGTYSYQEIDGSQYQKIINDLLEQLDAGNALSRLQNYVNYRVYGYTGEDLPPEMLAKPFSLNQPVNFIHNEMLWNGALVDAQGAPVDYTYEDGKNYVLVVEPLTPATRAYNVFCAFQYAALKNIDIPEEWEFPDLFVAEGIDPVNMLTGDFSWEYTDMMLFGKDLLEYTRYYESTAKDEDYGLGRGWTDNYFYKVIVHDLYAELIIPQSKHIYFTMNYDHTYSSHPGSAVTFETLGNGYRVKHKNGTVYTFNADGNLTKLEALGGNTVTISYDGDKRTKVENRCGSFTFTYQGEHIAHISDSAGRSISLAYKGDFLTSV